jgi:hypothetical protein
VAVFLLFILKETLMKTKHYIISATIALIIILITAITVRSCDKSHPVEHVVTVTDTITNVNWDTCIIKEVKVEKLKTTDTLYVYRDSIYQVVDSVNVEVPISTYTVERIFENDSSDLKIHLSLSGYNVKLDTLAYSLQYRYTTIQPPKKRNRLGFMFGVMGGVGIEPTTGKVVPSIGVGVGFGITTKKW